MLVCKIFWNSAAYTLSIIWPYIPTVGLVAYQLDLPEGSRLHDVFHVSLLKKQIKSKFTTIAKLPDFTIDGESKMYRVKVLDRRTTKLRTRTIEELLIQWSNLPPDVATWDDLTTIQSQFPEFPLSWGQDVFKGTGNVTNNELRRFASRISVLLFSNLVN